MEESSTGKPAGPARKRPPAAPRPHAPHPRATPPAPETSGDQPPAAPRCSTPDPRPRGTSRPPPAPTDDKETSQPHDDKRPEYTATARAISDGTGISLESAAYWDRICAARPALTTEQLNALAIIFRRIDARLDRASSDEDDET